MPPEPTVLMSDLVIGESPRWHDGRLWFCHWQRHEVIALAPDGTGEVVLRDEEISPHSIEFLPDGRMLVVPAAPGAAGRIWRREPDGTMAVHADLRDIAAGWNEIVVDGRGTAYVNGSDFDFMGWLAGTAEFVPGVIAAVTPDGAARRVADDIHFGNGMVVTPDNATLVVAESFGKRLTAFDIAGDGGLSGRRVFAGDLAPDGITMDADGAVWTSQTGGECVRVAAGGGILDRVELDRNPFAMMLGGPDGRTLFVMAATWNQADPFGGPRTGRVLTVPAPSHRAGWPGG